MNWPEAGARPQFPFGEMLRISWEAYAKNFLPLFLGHFIFSLINSFVGPFLNGPLWLGLCHQGLQALRGEKVTVESAFTGFNKFVPPFLLGLLWTALVVMSALVILIPAFGLCFVLITQMYAVRDTTFLNMAFFATVVGGVTLALIPSLVLTFLYAPSVLFMHEYGLGVQASMKASQRMVWSNRKEWLRLFGVIALLHLIGFLLCGIGLLFTTPWLIVVLAEGYRREQEAAGPPRL